MTAMAWVIEGECIALFGHRKIYRQLLDLLVGVEIAGLAWMGPNSAATSYRTAMDTLTNSYDLVRSARTVSDHTELKCSENVSAWAWRET